MKKKVAKRMKLDNKTETQPTEQPTERWSEWAISNVTASCVMCT